MMEKIDLTWNDVLLRARRICEQIIRDGISEPIIYGVPRGGIPVALMVAGILERPTRLVETPEEANIFVDDLIDSGRTEEFYLTQYPSRRFYALVDKQGVDQDLAGRWVSFPWERMGKEDAPTENIKRLLQYIGENPDREGLKDTPSRVIRSFETLYGGYKQSPADVMKVFEDGACDEMVLLKDVEFTSQCEHHMLPFFGKAHIAYIPDKKVIGVSKLARILEIYTRRLQIQERIGQQVTEALMTHLQPKGVACVLEARHLCMVCRGVQKQDSVMVTSSLRGAFLNEPMTRNEFMSIIRS